ncbi:MAG: phosphoribosylamine--glycine ligase [Verrucomicrobiae bacterium]|nr:phosphoribosylamine--glycine ligase [Verrucomicrobiae bacterium]
MKILVIGGGGREHALCWKLAQSPRATKLYCAPGNAGIAEVAECVEIQAEQLDALLKFARAEAIDLTVVGPEVPLCAGIVDLFQQNGLRIFGPNQKAAQLEGSKVFSKAFFLKHNIPTARAEICADSKAAKGFLRKTNYPVVIKADGLAAGKGVIIAGDAKDATDAIDAIMQKKVFGRSGDQVLIEECLVGEEASMLALVDGTSFITLPSAQDHKRIFDNDQGPNTGGMGAYSPAPVVTDALLKRIEKEIFQATLNGFAAEGIEYRGVLYAGIMVTSEGPKVIEFNVRFGDPETQAILPRLDYDLVDAMEATIDGRLGQLKWPIKRDACVSVVMAAGGYPDKYERGKAIRGLPDAAKLSNVCVFHAGTKQTNGDVVTNGGRVLGVTAWGADIRAAVKRAYEATGKIKFDGAHYRKDIAARALRR